jgi:hypothetical protein
MARFPRHVRIGGLDRLAKPFKPQDLLDLIAEIAASSELRLGGPPLLIWKPDMEKLLQRM